MKLRPLIPKAVADIFIGDWDNKGFKKYFANTSWMFFGRFFFLATGLVVSALVARHLGPDNFGLFNYVIGFGGLFAFIASFGINSILGRELLNNPEKKGLLLGNSIILNFVSSILLIALINTVAIFSDPDTYTRQLILIFSLTFSFQTLSVFDIYFQSEVKAKLITYVQIFVGVLSIILKLLGIYLGFYVAWFILVIIIEGAVSAFIITRLFLRTGIKPIFTPDLSLIKRLLIVGFPFMLTVATTSIYMKIDQVMIKHLLNTTETGLYSVAVKLTEAWYFIPSLITASLFPAIINARKVSSSAYYDRISRLLIMMSILSLVIIVPLILLAHQIITLLYGEAYIGAYKPFVIYIWSSIFVFLMPALQAYMIAEHRGYTILLSSFLGALVNVGLNIILIPKYGIAGSAFATLIAYTIPMVYLLIIFKRQKNYVNLK